MPRCGICGKEIGGGIVVEKECLEDLKQREKHGVWLDAIEAAKVAIITQKLANGQLIELPCGVGNKVRDRFSMAWTVTSIYITDKKIVIRCGHPGTDDYCALFPNEIFPYDERKCRICGCTDDHACPGGCYWVEVDLCSKCAEKEKNI